MRYSSLNTTWRPWPLSGAFLLVFAVLCLLILLSLELLLRDPRLLTFPAIPYLPTAVSVILGLIWATVAHDYKRLEPYFQLSHPNGAPAKSTLLLDYSYMSNFLVPFYSAKRRHTAVVLSGTSLLLISLALTPALSGIFADTTALITRSLVAPTANLALDRPLGSGFAYVAYSRAWLSAQLPRFTTDEYALLPFVSGAVNETWRGQTSLYEGELQCRPGVPEPLVAGELGQLPVGLKFATGEEVAQVQVGVRLTAGEAVVDIVLEDLFWRLDREDPEAALAFQDAVGEYVPDRPESYRVSFWVGGWVGVQMMIEGRLVYLWGPRTNGSDIGIQLWYERGGSANWTAVVCEPRYWTQGALATVDMSSGEVVELEREGNRTALDTPWTREFLGGLHSGHIGQTSPLVTNLTELAMIDVTFGRHTAQLPSIDSQLKRRFGETFETPLWSEDSKFQFYRPNTRGFAMFALFSRATGTLAGLFDPEELGRTYETAFKLLFAHAVTAEMVDEGTVTPRQVERTFLAEGWKVNADWARVTQVGFGLLTVITVLLMVLTWRRTLNLQDDPNNLAAAITLLSASPDVGRMLSNVEFHDPDAVGEMLSKDKRRYRLNFVPEQGPHIDIIDSNAGSGLLPPAEHRKPFPVQPPWFQSRWAGLGFSVLLCVLLLLLALVFVYDRSHGGLPTYFPPASLGYIVLFSYLPTILATIIELLLVQLAAYQCMMGPYKLLRRQQLSGSLPLLIDFDKSPPQFQFIRALRARDILLGILTAGSLLANVLAISFGALFTLETQTRTVSVAVTGQGLPRLVDMFRDPVAEAYYQLAASISGEIPPASWTTRDFYVLPFSTTAPHLTLSASSIAVGADISCALVPEDKLLTECEAAGDTYPGCIGLRPPLDPNDGNDMSMTSWIGVNHTCWHILYSGMPSLSHFMWRGPTANFFHRGKCTDSFFIGWAEHPADPNPTRYFFPFSHISHIDAVVLHCTAGLRGATVTAHAESTTTTFNASPLDISVMGDTSMLVESFLNSLAPGSPNWAATDVDGTHQVSWFSTLMAKLHPSLPIIGNPNSTSLPHADRVVGAFEDVYRRVFAVSLRLYADVLFESGEQTSVMGEAVQTMQRVRVNRAMWAMSTGIVGYFLVLVVGVYWGRGVGDVNAPTTLARFWALVYASGESEPGDGYALGEFLAQDGKTHWGVHQRRDFGRGKDVFMKKRRMLTRTKLDTLSTRRRGLSTVQSCTQ